MKRYEKPIALTNEELAEGIYAASGMNEEIDYENDPNCWTVDVTKSQVVASSGYANFRVNAVHPGTVVHISTKSTVTVVFNRPITDAYFEGFDVQVNGCTVVLTRESHGNSYNSADQYNSLLSVYSDDPEALQMVSATITCTHAPNVQGGFD